MRHVALLPVLDPEERVIGLISEHDLPRNEADQDRPTGFLPRRSPACQPAGALATQRTTPPPNSSSHHRSKTPSETWERLGVA
jgi:hypothetical protein